MYTNENEVFMVPVEKLKVHPINREIYVNDSTRKNVLLESIKENGILEPLIITSDYVVLSGARRLDCAKELGFSKVPCIIRVVKNPILAIIEHNKYREKTPIEIYNEIQVLKRELYDKKNIEKNSDKPNEVSNLTLPKKTRDIICETLNISTGYLSMLEQVMKNRNQIPEVVKRLETGQETVYGAYRELKKKTLCDVKIPGIFVGGFFGGKQYIIRDIVCRIPEHEVYVEPFGGFCSVLLNKPPSKIEVYNDISKDIVNLFICIKEYPLELYSELSLMPYSRWLYEQLLSILDEEFEVPNIKRAAQWYYLSQSTFGADMRKNISGGNWAHGITKDKCQAFRNKVDNLFVVAKRFYNVQIENRDYKYVLKHYDNEKVFFYVDPPYYETDSPLGISWSHEQHLELKKELDSVTGKWLLTYNDCPEINELYSDYNIEKIPQMKCSCDSRVTDGFREYYAHLIITNY